MPYPLFKLKHLLQKLKRFQYATHLDLNMGYDHVDLDADSRKLGTLVFPGEKYAMQQLPMGPCKSTDIFQENMSSDLEFIRAYIDDLLVRTPS